MTKTPIEIIKDELDRMATEGQYNHEIMTLVKAMSVAVDALDYFTEEELYNDIIHRTDGRLHSEFAHDKINSIAEILKEGGGK